MYTIEWPIGYEASGLSLPTYNTSKIQNSGEHDAHCFSVYFIIPTLLLYYANVGALVTFHLI